MKDVKLLLNLSLIHISSEAESAALAGETVTTGDPTYAGPLAGVQLGLKVYHAVEPEFKAEVDESVYDCLLYTSRCV